MTMSSSQILSHIGELVEEERNLRERHGERPLDARKTSGWRRSRFSSINAGICSINDELFVSSAPTQSGKGSGRRNR